MLAGGILESMKLAADKPHCPRRFFRSLSLPTQPVFKILIPEAKEEQN